jgi:hypothetical protein
LSAAQEGGKKEKGQKGQTEAVNMNGKTYEKIMFACLGLWPVYLAVLGLFLMPLIIIRIPRDPFSVVFWALVLYIGIPLIFLIVIGDILWLFHDDRELYDRRL